MLDGQPHTPEATMLGHGLGRTVAACAALALVAGVAGGCIGIVGSLSDEELEAMPLDELEQLAIEANPSLHPIPEAFVGRTGTGVPGTMALEIEGTAGEVVKAELPYEVIDGTRVTGGDVILPQGGAANAEPGTRQAAGFSIGRAYRWPKGTIYYAIDPATDEAFRSMVKAAMRRWKEATDGAVRFKKAVSSSFSSFHYVYFTRRDGCWSYQGRIGGRQELSLGDGCGYDAALHELGHAIGLQHEHVRPNRDKHIKVVWENVPDDWKQWMEKLSSDDDTLRGNVKTSYDPRSIMHYESGTRECLPGQTCVDGVAPWLVTLDGRLINGNTKITKKDIETVKSLYR